jgi:sulfur transfer complex TusBCD TusB component (DsrH family)
LKNSYWEQDFDAIVVDVVGSHFQRSVNQTPPLSETKSPKDVVISRSIAKLLDDNLFVVGYTELVDGVLCIRRWAITNDCIVAKVFESP